MGRALTCGQPLVIKVLAYAKRVKALVISCQIFDSLMVTPLPDCLIFHLATICRCTRCGEPVPRRL